MSTRSTGRRIHKGRPPSGVHAVASRPCFLLLATDPRFAAWLADEVRAHGAATIARTVASALEHKPPAGYWTAALLDVTLADGSGFTVLDALRLVDTDLPVLMFSDSERPSMSNLAFEKRSSLLTRPVPPGHVQMFLESPLVRVHGRRCRQQRARVAQLSGLEATILEITEAWRDRYQLTPTEADVLHLALQGLERSDIADRRGVTEATIKRQVNRLLSKTECAGLAELAAEAMREILVDARRLSSLTTDVVPPRNRTRRGG